MTLTRVWPQWARRAVSALSDPPREHSVAPLWFWNDAIEEGELARQIDDFAAHGVYGFMIHPRVGLPWELGWLSPRMLELMRFAVEHAHKSNLLVYLYDEAMYPSGSSAGQVVEQNPAFAARCLDYRELSAGEPSEAAIPELGRDQELVAFVARASGQKIAVFARPSDAMIRGVHYLDRSESNPQHLLPGQDPPHHHPAYADLLNPQAVAAFINLVYKRLADELGQYFGGTIRGIFTDEPNPGHRGKGPAVGGQPGNADIMEHVRRLLGYDFTGQLPALFFDDEPDAVRHRSAYYRAIRLRLNETYFAPLGAWCAQHGLALCGHPQWQDDLGAERHFQIPGQDIVGRQLLPGNGSAVRGRNSVLGRCSSSAMIHAGRRQCGQEIVGAYGHQLTFEEMKWVSDWCMVRGINLLFPHAFYYSYRGRRRDERPPDVGPRSSWWDRYGGYADYCRRLCWLNTDAHHVCNVAVLADECWVPWRAARVLQEAQRDFNYLEVRRLVEDAVISAEGIRIAGMQYQVLVIDWLPPSTTDGDPKDECDDGVWHSVRAPGEFPPAARALLGRLEAAGRLVEWRPDGSPGVVSNAATATTAAELLSRIAAASTVDLTTSASTPDLRYRHVCKLNMHWYLLFNEGAEPLAGELTVAANGPCAWLHPYTLEMVDPGGASAEGRIPFSLGPLETQILLIDGHQG